MDMEFSGGLAAVACAPYAEAPLQLDGFDATGAGAGRHRAALSPADMVGGAGAAHVDPEEQAKRKRRRAQWEQERDAKRRWDLLRRVADISTDVELLGREVGGC